MKQIIAISLLFAATVVFAQQVSKSVEPVKVTDTDTKKALFLDNSGYWTCPEGSEMYVRNATPENPTAKPPTHEDKNYYWLREGAVVVNGHPSKFFFTCIQEPAGK